MMQTDTKAYKKLDFKTAPHVMIVEARFYEEIGDLLAEGATAAIDAQGGSYECFTIPGALEAPAAIEMGVRSGKFDAYVVLGCVIRGATTHYEIVSNESARGLMDLSTRHALCLGNGILTVENVEQALERADKNRMDKGGGAAQAALEMLALKNRLVQDA
jgi:6,7-dimethyl-8-ribityllumazine synthase